MGCVMENKKWIKNTLKAFVNVVIFVFLAVALVSVSVTVFSSKDADGTAEIFGYQIRLVKSPSMEACAETNVSKYEIKSIPVNSMVLIETVPKTASEANEWYAALKVGDVLTFKYLYAEHVVITHRIVAIEENDDGGYTIQLAGDNKTSGEIQNQLQQTINTAGNDPYNYVIGKVTGVSPAAGTVLNFLQSPIGIVFVIILPCVIIIIFEALKIAKALGDKKRGELQSEKDREIEELRRRLSELEDKSKKEDTGGDSE